MTEPELATKPVPQMICSSCNEIHFDTPSAATTLLHAGCLSKPVPCTPTFQQLWVLNLRKNKEIDTQTLWTLVKTGLIHEVEGYKMWLRLVNIRVRTLSGVNIDDLPDWDSRAAWTDQTEPDDAAHTALDGADFPFED